MRYWKEPKPAPKSSSASPQPRSSTPAQNARALSMSEIAAVSVISIARRPGSTSWRASVAAMNRSMLGSVTESAETLIAIVTPAIAGSRPSMRATRASTIRSISPISP